jgi:large subunit ribosomal protein L15
MPLYRRLGKRGFNNKRFAPQYITINVSDLEKIEGVTEVTAQVLDEQGIISVPKNNDGIKILGRGELTKKLDVKVAKFTASAKEKIEKAGGTATEV